MIPSRRPLAVSVSGARCNFVSGYGGEGIQFLFSDRSDNL